jgi:hypothetical protein
LLTRTHWKAALVTLALAIVSALPAAAAAENATLRLLMKHPTDLAFDAAFLVLPVFGLLLVAALLLSPKKPLSERSSKRIHGLWFALIINPAAYVVVAIAVISSTDRGM